MGSDFLVGAVTTPATSRPGQAPPHPFELVGEMNGMSPQPILKNTVTNEAVDVVGPPVNGNVLVQSQRTGLLDVVPIEHLHLIASTCPNDPCPVCGGFDGSHWVESGPGFDEWACRCGHTYLITVDEPSG